MVSLIILAVLLAYSAAVPVPDPSQDSTGLTNGRIVGGQTTTIDKFPYQISLHYGSRYICGGSIYSAKIVITAAHCFDDDDDVQYVRIVAGSSYRLQGGISVPVMKFVRHPDFVMINKRIPNNDVAILLLAKALEFSETIQPIGLIQHNRALREGLKATVSGWGLLDERGSLANQLQYVNVITIDRARCAKLYEYDPDFIVTDVMLCAGEDYGGKDACNGDSGGPLVLEGKLVGIVSWGDGCARATAPGVYSDVAALRPWIDQTINELLKE